MAECDIRRSEKFVVGAVSIENVLWFWDDRVDIFQNTNISSSEFTANISFSADDAIRYARMILEKYEGKR